MSAGSERVRALDGRANTRSLGCTWRNVARVKTPSFSEVGTNNSVYSGILSSSACAFLALLHSRTLCVGAGCPTPHSHSLYPVLSILHFLARKWYEDRRIKKWSVYNDLFYANQHTDILWHFNNSLDFEPKQPTAVKGYLSCHYN